MNSRDWKTTVLDFEPTCSDSAKNSSTLPTISPTGVLLPFRSNRSHPGNIVLTDDDWDRRPPPPVGASFADELQWLALERPQTLAAVQDLVTGLVARHRPAPQPSLTFELSPVLEYRHIEVTDHDSLLAPEDRLGRRMHDLNFPPSVQGAFDRALHRAKLTQREQTYTYRANRKQWRGRIALPSPDLVLVTVTPA